MKILITGGAGFIASHVADRFLELGHQVVIVDNLITGRRENIPTDAVFYEMDICSPELASVFEKERPEVVSHHAAQMDVRKSVADPIYDANVNVIGGLNILQMCVKYGTRKVMFSSTGGAIYGEQDYFPADEEHPLRPLSPYGITKLTTEKYLFFYYHTYKLKYTILRYANIYGPRQNPHGEAGVVAIFSQKILNGELPVINGDGLQTRDYVFVGDVVKANELTLEDEECRIFNIGTGIETTVNELFQLIVRQIGIPVKKKHGPAKPGEQMRSVLTSNRIFEQLGWRPSTTLKDGLEQTVEYFRNRRRS